MKILNLKSILFISFVLIFLNNNNFFKKFYLVLTQDYSYRFSKAYIANYFSGYCEKEGHGYIHAIKEKYNINTAPKIINFDNKRRKIPYWIFYNKFSKIDDQQVILLNYNKKNNFDFDKFLIVDNKSDKCFYLIRKNNGTN